MSQVLIQICIIAIVVSLGSALLVGAKQSRHAGLRLHHKNLILGGCPAFLFYGLLFFTPFVSDAAWRVLLLRMQGTALLAALALMCFGMHITANAPGTVSMRAWLHTERPEPRFALLVLVSVFLCALAPVWLGHIHTSDGSGDLLYRDPAAIALGVCGLAIAGWLAYSRIALGNQLQHSPEGRLRYNILSWLIGCWAVNRLAVGYTAPVFGVMGANTAVVIDVVIFLCTVPLFRPHKGQADIVVALERFRLEYLTRLMDEALVAVDQDGNIRLINRAAESYIDVPTSEAIGQSASEILDGRIWTLGSLDLSEGSPQDRNSLGVFERANGESGYVDSRIVGLADPEGVRVGHIEILHDVTEHKDAQQRLAEYSQHLEELVAERSNALAESESRYRGVVEHLGECLLIVLDDTVRFANPTATELLGAGAPTLLGENVDGLWATGITAPWSTIRAELAEKPHALWRGDMEWQVGDKEYRIFSVTATATKWEESQAILLLGSDVTDERKLQANLDRVRRIQALGTLTGGIAHDFNNYLTGIMGRLSLIDGLDDVPDHVSAQLSRALDAAEKARMLVTRLMRFSRSEQVDHAPTDIVQMLRETQPLIESLVREEINIQWHLPSTPVYANVDPSSIQEILLNLVKNADQAMEDVAGIVLLTVRETVIEGEKQLQIIVADTGPGMEAEIADRAFEPFFTTKPAGTGHGLGLALAHQIMQEHDGTIELETGKGHGATFVLTLPKCAAPESTQGVGPDLAVVKGQGEHILVVDDDADVLSTAKEMLTRLGYRVTTATNGRIALETLEQGDDFAAFLVDVVMPEMNGIEFAQALKERNNETPLLFMTGYDPDPERMKRLGLDAVCLSKPFRISDLAKLLNEEIATARAA